MRELSLELKDLSANIPSSCSQLKIEAIEKKKHIYVENYVHKRRNSLITKNNTTMRLTAIKSSQSLSNSFLKNFGTHRNFRVVATWIRVTNKDN